jgi:hypothetical protein
MANAGEGLDHWARLPEFVGRRRPGLATVILAGGDREAARMDVDA